jgi:hypothetical protein
MILVARSWVTPSSVMATSGWTCSLEYTTCVVFGATDNTCAQLASALSKLLPVATTTTVGLLLAPLRVWSPIDSLDTGTWSTGQTGRWESKEVAVTPPKTPLCSAGSCDWTKKRILVSGAWMSNFGCVYLAVLYKGIAWFCWNLIWTRFVWKHWK